MMPPVCPFLLSTWLMDGSSKISRGQQSHQNMIAITLLLPVTVILEFRNKRYCRQHQYIVGFHNSTTPSSDFGQAPRRSIQPRHDNVLLLHALLKTYCRPRMGLGPPSSRPVNNLGLIIVWTFFTQQQQSFLQQSNRQQSSWSNNAQKGFWQPGCSTGAGGVGMTCILNETP